MVWKRPATVPRFRSEDHGHSVVNRPHQFIRVRGNDGERLHPLTVRFAPYVPQASEGEQLFALKMNPHWDFALPLLTPIVETVSRNNATCALVDRDSGSSEPGCR